MEKRKVETLEEYFLRREKLRKLHTFYNVLFLLIMACLVLVLFTWNHGFLRNYIVSNLVRVEIVQSDPMEVQLTQLPVHEPSI